MRVKSDVFSFMCSDKAPHLGYNSFALVSRNSSYQLRQICKMSSLAMVLDLQVRYRFQRVLNL